MKVILIFSIFLLLQLNFVLATDVNSNKIYNQNITTEKIYQSENILNKIIDTEKWGIFWLTFIISAIGVYMIYGLPAGFVTVAIIYFVTNNNKKAMKRAIWGCVLGCLFGAAIRVLTLL